MGFTSFVKLSAEDNRYIFLLSVYRTGGMKKRLFQGMQI